MNAPPEGLTTRDRQKALQESIRNECEQMLRIIDAQLADLHVITEQLQRKRREWAARFDEQALVSVSQERNRAPRGSVRTLITRELATAPEGLDVQSLSRRVSAVLPIMNPRSVAQALSKMSGIGVVENTEGKWKLVKR